MTAVLALGVYDSADLTNEQYHAQDAYLSSTSLKAFLPEHYAPYRGSGDALAFGTLVHAMVLEPDTLDTYTVLDADTIGVKADGSKAENPTMTGAWKRAVAAAERDGTTVVAAADWRKAQDMTAAVYRHGEAFELLSQSGARPELSVFAEVSGVPCKARFDLFAALPIDLKTTSSKPGANNLVKSVIDFGYDVSAAHYHAVAQAAGLDVEPMRLVFVGKEPPHYVTVCVLSDELLTRGEALRAEALDRSIRDPWYDGQPAYPGDVGEVVLDLPGWARL